MAPTAEQARRIKTDQMAGKKRLKSRVRRYLKSTEPQMHEKNKSTLLFKGIACNQPMATVLQELRALQAPNAKLLLKKNQIAPFEAGGESIEFLTTKNDCALFAMASNNKKRPNNLILGRTFDRQVLDMAELGVLRFKSALKGDYPGTVPKKRIGSKPLLLFCGDLWQTDKAHGNLQNLLTDFYRGDVVDKVVLNGLDHLIMFTLAQPPTSSSGPGAIAPPVLLHQRTYFVQLKKDPKNANGSNVPVPWLENCGPDFDFVLRRTQWAAPDLFKAARRVPHAVRRAQHKKKKNQSTNLFGETVGRLHLSKQNVEHMGGRKVKALRRAEKEEALEEQAAVEHDLEREAQAETAQDA